MLFVLFRFWYCGPLLAFYHVLVIMGLPVKIIEYHRSAIVIVHASCGRTFHTLGLPTLPEEQSKS